MERKHIAVHRLLTDYIDQIGCTEIAERFPEIPTTGECSTWSANYQIVSGGNHWVLTVFRHKSDSPLLKLDFRRTFPSKVVADIMGRYHCRLINNAVDQANTSRPEAFPCN